MSQQKDLGAVFLNVIKDESLPTKRFRIYDTEVQAQNAVCGPVEHRGLLARIVAEVPPPDIRLSLQQLDDVFNSWRTDELARTVSLYDYIKIKLFGTGAVDGKAKN